MIIVPAVSDAGAKERFPQGWRTLKPYLRLTPQPAKVANRWESRAAAAPR